MEKQVFYSVNFYSTLGRELRYLTTQFYPHSEHSVNYLRFMTVVRRDCRDIELSLRKKTGFHGKVVFFLGPKPSGPFIVEINTLSIPEELQ